MKQNNTGTVIFEVFEYANSRKRVHVLASDKHENITNIVGVIVETNEHGINVHCGGVYNMGVFVAYGDIVNITRVDDEQE
jgi:hypothetical protein